ncbi:hypothetical protein EDC96DRAFT_443776, partial [Choanephora cucurbitarum]
LAHSVSESTAQNKVFIYEPYLIPQLTELISPDNQVDLRIQTYALYALDGISRHRNKLSEVVTAVNASANHGPLMQILRKINANEPFPYSFADAMYAFIAYLLQTQPGGQMLMSAGIIPILVQIVGNYDYPQLKGIASVVGLLDTIVNSFSTSFSAFCNAQGLDTLLHRIKTEVDHCITSPLFERLAVIKPMLKFLCRMMESSGTADGLRNLIDSTLPYSLKSIMESPSVFGNSIFSLAINVSTTLIHNEPTSLPILQEAKLPQTFLHTISVYETPNNEVLMAAVNAFGAMCLNAQGLDMFNKENPLPHFFELMSSDDFLRNPLDVDSATGLGSTMDELIRHHPSLKKSVFECVTALIEKVLVEGNKLDGIGKPSDDGHLLQTRLPGQEITEQNDNEKPEKVECLIVSFIDLVARFLEGLFQNQSNIKEFVEAGCPEKLLDYFTIPLLPANFSVTIASDSLSYLFRMITEVSPLPTILAIAAKVKESLGFILENQEEYDQSRLLDLIDTNPNDLSKVEKGNKILRQLIQLHGYVGLLSNICCSSILSHGKNASSLITELLSEPKENSVICQLGRLNRVMVWEGLLLKEGLPSDWYNAKSLSASNLKKGTSSNSEHPLGIRRGPTALLPESASLPSEEGNEEKTVSEKVPSAKDPRMMNIKHFKIFLNEIPQLLTPMLQCLIKLSVSRRSGNTLPKSQTIKFAEYVSDILYNNMTWLPVVKADASVCKYDYFSSIYTMCSLLLRDERTQSSLQAPLAVAFEKKGNVAMLLTQLKQIWDTAVELYQQKEQNKSTLARINICLEHLLNVLLHISSPKALKDSTYLGTMTQKDKKAADYFDPYEWIVALELSLVPLKDYLVSPEFHLFSKPVNQALIKIFEQIMKGEGNGLLTESSTASSIARHFASGSNDPFGSYNSPLATSPFTLLRTPVVAAERNIQTLVDMGFMRESAEQALIRCNNQVSRAVDYLFSHPTPMLPNYPPNTETSNQSTETSAHSSSNNQDDNRQDQPTEAHNEDDDDNDDEDDDDDEGDDSDEDGRHSHDDDDEEDENHRSSSGNIEKLKTVRQDLCTTLPLSLITLADQRDDLVFDIRDLLIILSKHEAEPAISLEDENLTKANNASIRIVTLLIDQISNVRQSDQSALLSSRLRLLALLLREGPMQRAMGQLSSRFAFLFDMLDFPDENQPLPVWSAPAFLVLEALISQADEPKKVKLTATKDASSRMFGSQSSDDDDSNHGYEEDKDNETSRTDDPMEDVTSTPSVTNNKTTSDQQTTAKQREKLLQCCVSLLSRNTLTRDNMYAVLRMIVRLTKNHESALFFVHIGGIPRLFAKPRSNLEGLQGQQAFIILILRHIVESMAVLKSTMKDVITNWFTNPRPRNMDISAFVRSNAHVALRDPSAFVDVTTDICRLARYDEFEINRHIKLRKQEDEKKTAEEEQPVTKQTSSSETVVYYLLNEIMTIRTEVTALAAKKEPLTDEEKKQENIKFVYTGFLLQCLVELISSYPSCKYDIFNFCKKQNGQRTTTLDGKHRSFVSMLINDLLPYNHLNPSSEESRKQQGLSTWTISTLVAMSYDASSSTELTAQQKNELIQVRKYVLEAIVRAFKEAINSSDGASTKYSKYLALSDLCYRILNARPNVGSSIPRSLGGGLNQTQNNSKKEDVALSNSKIMLDKGFVSVLTSAISDVDINYPHSKIILNTMLKPLEQLTKLAIKTDDATDTEEDDQDKMDTTEEAIHMPNTSVDENDQAPDLYRNSALGMFDAGSAIDEDEYNSGEYSDMFGSSVDGEEEYDEESGSDLSDMSEGDDEGPVEEMEAIIHGGEYDSDEMDEDDDNSDDIDAEAQLIDDDDEDDEEEGGREMTWHLEDIEEEPGIVRAEAVIETGDDRDNQSHMRHITDPYEEEDEMDALSDFDDASENLDGDSDNDIADGVLLDAEDLDTPFLPTDLQDDLVIEDDELEGPRSIIPAGFRRRFHNGRHSWLEGVGRSLRGQGRTHGQEDVLTHPLLSNNAASQSGNGNAARSMLDEPFGHRPPRVSGLSNWHEFEDMIGGNAVRVLEDLFTNAPSANQTGPLRVDVEHGPGGVLRTIEFDRFPSLGNIGHGHHTSTNNAQGSGNNQVQEGLVILHDFQPMSSGERWNQEARMMYGTNLSDKALNLVNEILNILIPIAIEDDKKAREEEKKRPAEEAKKAAEEAAINEANSSTAGATEVEASSESNENNNANQAIAQSTEVGANDNNAPTERTTIEIHGQPVDISGTGIDIEFLEALPDELREEVVNQHLRNRPTPAQPAEDDSISPEFLDALPPEIREEVLQQEAIERERRERQNRQATSNTSATTTPRPFEPIRPRRRRSVPEEDENQASGSAAKKKAKARRTDGAAQLVERSQLSTLVRLLFVPQTISKSLLNRLLLNLCENSKTRSDLLSYLVCVLYDGNNDLVSVDNSFSLLISGKGATKHSQSKTTSTSANKGPNSTNVVTENVPNFIAQRCLEALTYIVSCNEQSMAYFLTESESLMGLKRSLGSKKGKSKEKVPNSWNKYPILILMSLLDRPVFIENSTLMEQLMDLLSTMCRPFPVLVKKYQEKVENKQKDPALSERPMPKPPTIPDYYLKLIVHVLTNGECSSKTFQYTLNAISHLSALDGAQQTIVNELMEDARQSSIQIGKDLENLLDVLDHTMPGTEISSTILAPFSAATSHQAKLLRVLKTLDYMFSRKPSHSTNNNSTENKSADLEQLKNEKRVLQIYENLNFLPLWQTLGKCLSVIREKEELINVATVLLPLIESFMVVSKCAAEKGQNSLSEKVTTPAIEQQLSLSTASPESFFFAFTEKHKKVLNIMVRNNPTLMSGSFALLVRNPKMLEFDNKRNYFVQQLHKRTTPRENYPMLQLNVRRQYVFEDSYHQLQGRTGDEIKNGKLAVKFYDEEGVDAGGVTREWFSVLARQMFDPNYALFITSAADKLTYQPNRDSAVNPDHLSFFKFVGRVIGKAIYDGRLLDAYFTRSFYKHILGRTVDYRDVEALDPEYYKSLVWMLENDITDIIDLTFSIETDFFGTKETVDLKPNGRNIPVTEANKHEYVTLVTEQKLTTAIKDQINAFVQGFHDVIPASLIQIFNEQELELLISGLPDIDIDDWKNNTEYMGYSSTSPPVQWFWRAVRSFDQEERAKLLQFATGTSKVPLEGFSQLQGSGGVQKFQIHKDFGGQDRLPSAHTCFNQVDLPQYDSYENLRTNLFKAINECSTGFAFV